MNDLISRQAAIDETWKEPSYTDPYNVLTEVRERIQSLPSAQTEQPSEIQDILDYLDTALHPIISPEHWNVYSELHDMISTLPSAQPSATDTNVGGTNDTISRQAILDAVDGVDWYHQNKDGEMVHGANSDEHQAWYKAEDIYKAIKSVPSAQPNLSEAYSKAVFTWLRDYQIRAAELKGRYTPYEVLSWVANDWRKEHERSD